MTWALYHASVTCWIWAFMKPEESLRFHESPDACRSHISELFSSGLYSESSGSDLYDAKKWTWIVIFCSTTLSALASKHSFLLLVLLSHKVPSWPFLLALIEVFSPSTALEYFSRSSRSARTHHLNGSTQRLSRENPFLLLSHSTGWWWLDNDFKFALHNLF